MVCLLSYGRAVHMSLCVTRVPKVTPGLEWPGQGSEASGSCDSCLQRALMHTAKMRPSTLGMEPSPEG